MMSPTLGLRFCNDTYSGMPTWFTQSKRYGNVRMGHFGLPLDSKQRYTGKHPGVIIGNLRFLDLPPYTRIVAAFLQNPFIQRLK